MNSSDLQALFEKLIIPTDVTRYEELLSTLQIDKWKENLASTLRSTFAILTRKEENFGNDAKARAVFVLLPFIPSYLWLESQQDGPSILLDDWVTASSLHVALDLVSLSIISRPSPELVNEVLASELRPIFKSSLHPHLHSETGRKLLRPAGGPLAMQDYYEDQAWKRYPGIANLVLWCVHAIEPEKFEQMWHLVIPPVMTLMDDYETKYKLQGVIVVQEMLQRVPKDLLRRTGVDGLLRQSLRNSLVHLQSPEAGELLKTAIRVSVDLVLLTTGATGNGGVKASSEQFDQLSSLLGEGIISGIWLYAEDKPIVVTATFEALPHLIKALGMGTIRFLQVLVPQLTHSLIPQPSVKPDRKLQLSALRVIDTLLDACAPRIDGWKQTLLDAVARCWVGIVDEGKEVDVLSQANSEDRRQRDNVKHALQDFCVHLSRVCPLVMKDEYPRFLIDSDLFQSLFARVSIENAI